MGQDYNLLIMQVSLGPSLLLQEIVEIKRGGGFQGEITNEGYFKIREAVCCWEGDSRASYSM